MLDPSGGPSAPGRRFNGERGAPLRYAPTPHSPQGRLYGFATQKGCLIATDESIDYLIAIKGIFTFPTYHCQGACMNGTNAKSEFLKVKWWRENVFPRKSTFSVPVSSLCAIEPYSLRIRRIGIWDFSCVLGIYIVKVPPLPSIQLRSQEEIHTVFYWTQTVTDSLWNFFTS